MNPILLSALFLFSPTATMAKTPCLMASNVTITQPKCGSSTNSKEEAQRNYSQALHAGKLTLPGIIIEDVGSSSSF